MPLSLKVTPHQRLHIAFAVTHRKKGIVLGLQQLKFLPHYFFTHIYSITLKLTPQLSPFPLLILTRKPNLIVSENLIEHCLLSEQLHQKFNITCNLHLVL